MEGKAGWCGMHKAAEGIAEWIRCVVGGSVTRSMKVDW